MSKISEYLRDLLSRSSTSTATNGVELLKVYLSLQQLCQAEPEVRNEPRGYLCVKLTGDSHKRRHVVHVNVQPQSPTSMSIYLDLIHLGWKNVSVQRLVGATSTLPAAGRLRV